jgi:DNA-binding NarL/FixJ family response regulator
MPIGTVAGSSGVFGSVGPRVCGTLYLEFEEKSSPKVGEQGETGLEGRRDGKLRAQPRRREGADAPGRGGRDTSVNTAIRVLLADDHTMFREGLASILASYGGMEVVAEVPNDEEALGLARELSPDVVVMQVQMPFWRAVATLQAMRSFSEPPKVVIVTMFESPHYVRDLTGAGARAYLLKTSSSEHLVAVVRAAVLDPEGKNAVVGMPPSMLEEAGEGVEDVLSARELEIVLLAARGLSNAQIASSLHVAEATVKRHLANIYPKMGVSSRMEAARTALREDWITIEEITEPGEGA